MATTTLIRYDDTIANVLDQYVSTSYGSFTRKLIIDSQYSNFIVILMGWQGYGYIHQCLIHLEIIEDKVWLHANNTEDSITELLIEAGIPKDHIVIGYQTPFERALTDFAVG